MKLYIGDTAVRSLGISKVDISTNDATIVASDMQTGMTAYARGVKLTGTGKSFAFASYATQTTNVEIPVPGMINVVGVSSKTCPIQMLMAFPDMKDADFSVENTIANAVVDGETCPITVQVTDGNLTFTCSKTIQIEVFYGKDDHV